MKYISWLVSGKPIRLSNTYSRWGDGKRCPILLRAFQFRLEFDFTQPRTTDLISPHAVVLLRSVDAVFAARQEHRVLNCNQPDGRDGSNLVPEREEPNRSLVKCGRLPGIKLHRRSRCTPMYERQGKNLDSSGARTRDPSQTINQAYTSIFTRKKHLTMWQLPHDFKIGTRGLYSCHETNERSPSE